MNQFQHKMIVKAHFIGYFMSKQSFGGTRIRTLFTLVLLVESTLRDLVVVKKPLQQKCFLICAIFILLQNTYHDASS